MKFEENIFLEIINNSIYYNPATKHYGSFEINVYCDRCQKNNLMDCFGHKI